MKATRAIEILQEIVAKHGDDVKLWVADSEPHPVLGTSYNWAAEARVLLGLGGVDSVHFVTAQEMPFWEGREQETYYAEPTGDAALAAAAGSN